ncbi:MAG: hypothetical protein WC022_00070 [Parcubacteria group bacterium]
MERRMAMRDMETLIALSNGGLNFKIGMVEYPKEVDPSFPKMFLYRETSYGREGVLCWVATPENTCCKDNVLNIESLSFVKVCGEALKCIGTSLIETEKLEARLLQEIPFGSAAGRDKQDHDEYMEMIHDALNGFCQQVEKVFWENVYKLSCEMNIQELNMVRCHRWIKIKIDKEMQNGNPAFQWYL